MADPRSENAKKFKVDGGLVTGIELVYREVEGSKYQLLKAELIDEKSAAGNTVAKYMVFDKNNLPSSDEVRLAWPWPTLETSQLSGNPNSQHMITNGFDPAKTVGPLGMYVADKSGTPISDIIGGLGLPNNRHVCFNLIWKERTIAPPPSDDNTGTVIVGADYSSKFDALIAKMDAVLIELKKLTTHLGVK